MLTWKCSLKIEHLSALGENTGSIGDLDVCSYSWGCTGPKLDSSLTPHQYDLSISELDIVLRSSVASPLLMVACLTGRNLGQVVLSWRTTENEERTVYSLHLKDTFVTRFNQTGSSQAGPNETAPWFDQLGLSAHTIEMECGLPASTTAVVESPTSPVRAGFDWARRTRF